MKTIPYLTTGEAASYIGCSVYHLRRLIRNGEVECVSIASNPDGRPTYRISIKSLEKFACERSRIGRVNDDRVKEWRRNGA